MIPDEIATFLSSGVSVYVGTRSADLEPEGTRVWAVLVEADREHVTAFVQQAAAAPILANLDAHPEIALAFSRPTDHVACQVKGVFVGARPGRDEERPEIDRQAEGFLRELERIGIPRAMTAGWTAWPSVALRVRVTDVYRQTPGPGAGEPL